MNWVLTAKFHTYTYEWEKIFKNQDILVCIIGPLYKFMKKTSMSKFNLNKSKLRCYEYRKRILEISQKVTALHIGGAFSCLEILDYIYIII